MQTTWYSFLILFLSVFPNNCCTWFIAPLGAQRGPQYSRCVLNTCTPPFNLMKREDSLAQKLQPGRAWVCRYQTVAVNNNGDDGGNKQHQPEKGCTPGQRAGGLYSVLKNKNRGATASYRSQGLLNMYVLDWKVIVWLKKMFKNASWKLHNKSGSCIFAIRGSIAFFLESFLGSCGTLSFLSPSLILKRSLKG